LQSRVCVAQIGAAHGTGGEVKLRAFTEDSMAITLYGPLETDDGSRRLQIEALRASKDHMIARFKGVGDRNAAERLRNLKLYVAREKLPAPPDEETFYHADLVGLAAKTGDGRDQLGTIIGIHNFGAGDLLEIRPAAGGPTVMLPFTQDVVPAVDVVAGCITVNPPEGAFEAIPPLKGEGRRRSRGGGVGNASAKKTPTRSRSARSTSPLQGED
jgi:16S rRNA processing protein RimM